MLETVQFIIWARPPAAVGSDQDYFKADHLMKCHEPKDGYLRCPHISDLFKDEEALIRTEDDKRFVFECTKVGATFNAFCKIELPFFENIEITVDFGRKYFDESQRLIDRVYDIICGYWVPDPKRTPAINYCN